MKNQEAFFTINFKQALCKKIVRQVKKWGKVSGPYAVSRSACIMYTYVTCIIWSHFNIFVDILITLLKDY